MSHDPRHVAYLMLVAATALAPLPAAADTKIASRMIVAQAETPPPEGEQANDKKKKKSEEREQKRQKSERNQNRKDDNQQQQGGAVQQDQPGGNAKKQQNENRKAQQQQFQEQQRQKQEAEQQQRQMQREQQKVKQEQFKEQQRQKQEAEQKQRQLQREQQKVQQEQFKEQQRLKREADQKQKQLEFEQKKALQDQAKEQQRQKLEAEQQQKKLENEQKKLAKEPPQQPPSSVQPDTTRDVRNRDTAPVRDNLPANGNPPPVVKDRGDPSAIQADDPNKQRKFSRAKSEEIRKNYRRDARQERSFDDLKKNRKERTIANGNLRVIEEPDRRIIVKQDNRTFIRHDESERFRRISPDARTIRRADGTSTTFMTRSGGVRIYDVTDRNGRLLYRYRRYPDGREVILIDNRRYYRRDNNRTRDVLIGAGIGLVVGSAIALATPEVRIPRDRYIVDYGRASDDDLYEALTAPPIERLDRGYSLEEIRYSAPLRDRMRRIDLDTVTFDFGSWEVGPDQARALDRLAEGINRMLERNPDEIVMIEGHTDAVGSEEDNLTLSDRRAQSVAEILTTDYGVPPENLVTQGYGEEQLKIPTEGPERANRRITVRRIGPLLSGQFDGDRSSGGPPGDRYDNR